MAPLPGLEIAPLEPADLDAADRVTRLAFGTFIGLADPLSVFGDAEMLRSRYAAAPDRVFAARLDGEIAGSVVATRWGSFGFFGPLTVRPDLWDRGIAARLLEPVMDRFEHWGVRQAGLYTFAQSTKHVWLYQRFGFWPQQLTAVMGRAPAAAAAASPWSYSHVPDADCAGVLEECRELTDAIYPGLDVELEIRAVRAQAIGDTVLLRSGATLEGFAVCHCGPGGEASSGLCYVKFAAVRPGEGAGERFEALLEACEAFALERGAGEVVAGVNLARHDAYRRMLARGYRSRMHGVVMQRPNEPGYCRPAVHVLDDLR